MDKQILTRIPKCFISFIVLSSTMMFACGTKPHILVNEKIWKSPDFRKIAVMPLMEFNGQYTVDNIDALFLNDSLDYSSEFSSVNADFEFITPSEIRSRLDTTTSADRQSLVSLFGELRSNLIEGIKSDRQVERNKGKRDIKRGIKGGVSKELANQLCTKIGVDGILMPIYNVRAFDSRTEYLSGPLGTPVPVTFITNLPFHYSVSLFDDNGEFASHSLISSHAAFGLIPKDISLDDITKVKLIFVNKSNTMIETNSQLPYLLPPSKQSPDATQKKTNPILYRIPYIIPCGDRTIIHYVTQEGKTLIEILDSSASHKVWEHQTKFDHAQKAESANFLERTFEWDGRMEDGSVAETGWYKFRYSIEDYVSPMYDLYFGPLDSLEIDR